MRRPRRVEFLHLLCATLASAPLAAQAAPAIPGTIVILQPAPQKGCLDLNIVKGSSAVSKCGKLLKLDPITFMIKESCA